MPNKQPYSRRKFLKQAGLSAAALASPIGLSVFQGCSTPNEPDPVILPPPTPEPAYVNAALEITDVFTGEAIPSGHVTFPNGKTIPIRDGLAEITASEELLSGSYRVLVQPESEKDFVTHSRVVELVDEGAIQLQVLPWTHNEFSYEQMLDKFMHGDDFNKYTQRWPDEVEIISYHYDESHMEISGNTASLIHSQDPSLIASKRFIEDTIEAYAQCINWLPQDSGISLQSFVESENEVEFPKLFNNQEENVIFNVGSPDAPWMLSRGHTHHQNKIINALLRQKTGTPNAANFDAPGAVYIDVIENFGIRTSGNEVLFNGDSENILGPIAPLLLTASYSFAPGSGLYALDSPLPAKNGTELAVIDHYEPD